MVSAMRTPSNCELNRVDDTDQGSSDIRRVLERAISEARSRNKNTLVPPSYTESHSSFRNKKLQKFMREHPTFKGGKMPVSNNLHGTTPSEVAVAFKLLELDDPKDRASMGGVHVDKAPLKEAMRMRSVLSIEEVKKLTTRSGRPVYLEI
ncbi:hypothetical protein ACHQM5_019811 [Ranunculus cassubicifolius]